MGRPKNRKKHFGTQTTEPYEATDSVFSTLLQCSFIQAHLSNQSLKISLKVDPEKCGSHHQIFNAFIRGDITCRSISAEVLPVVMHESCDECGGMSPKQETLLSFTVVATDLKSDCNICHDHGSLSKYKKCKESSPKHAYIRTRAGRAGKRRIFLDETQSENVALPDKVKRKEAKSEVAKPEARNDEDSERLSENEDIARNKENVESHSESENVTHDSDDFEQFSESEDFDDDIHDKDFQLEGEDDITVEEDPVDTDGSKKKRKHRQMKAKKRDKVDQSELASKKKIFTCSGCGRQKNYGSEKCGHCPNETKPNECKYCEETFKSKALLLEHQLTHGTEPRFLCTECGATFARRNNMVRHKRRHKGVKAYKCELCDKIYADASQLKIHKRVHTGERPFQCDFCGRSYTSSSALNAHTKFHHKKALMCTICDRTFSSKSYLAHHLTSHTGEQPFACSVCGKGCFTKFHLKRHLWTHNKVRSHRCEECSKAFYTAGELKVHCRVHTGERPFKCTLCEKAFTMASTLKKHMRCHSIEKPFNCNICQKDFATDVQHSSHMKIHRERKFICEICGKRFYSISGLRSHDISHKGIKKNTCDKCGKTYRSAWYLKIHKKTHTGENLIQCHTCGDWFTDPSYFKLHQRKYCKGNPVYCKICGQDFPHNRALTSHMGIHTGERPYGCEVCGKAFAKPESLSEHVKRHSDNTSFRCKVCSKCFINANELRKHEERHSKVKRKASLPDSLKPGHQKASLASELSSSRVVEVEALSRDTRQASQSFAVSHESKHMSHVHVYPHLDCSDEDVEGMMQPVDLRPVVQYIEKSKGNNRAQDHFSTLSTNPGIRHDDVMHTRPLPHAQQHSDMVHQYLQVNRGGHQSAITDGYVEEIQCQIICDDYE